MQKNPQYNSDTTEEAREEAKGEATEAHEDNPAVRLTELEIKFAYQQEAIESLSGEVSKQWTVIDRLTRQLGMMQEQIVSGTLEADKAQDEPPPPHY